MASSNRESDRREDYRMGGKEVMTRCQVAGEEINLKACFFTKVKLLNPMGPISYTYHFIRPVMV